MLSQTAQELPKRYGRGKLPSEQITVFQSRSELYTIRGSGDAAFYIFRAFERR